MRVDGSRQAGYDAFISYSQAVKGELAAALQGWLERFATPWYRPRSLRIFRDYTSLSANEDLGQTIERALEASSWLILLASPEAAASRWVNREVQWWRDHKPADRVCIVLTAGDLRWADEDNDWDWSRTTALPASARGMFTQQPLWVDLSSISTPKELDRANPVLLNSVAQVAAPIRGVDKDFLVGEHITLHRRARRQRNGGIAGLVVLTVAALVAALLAVVQANNANTQRRTALLQRDIATSRQLAANAELVADVDPQLASLLSVAAFDIRDTPEARTGLLHQLANQIHGSESIERFLSARTGTTGGVAFSPDGHTLAIGGNKVTLVNLTTGSRLAALDTSGSSVVFSPRGDSLAVVGQDGIELWDVARRAKAATFPTGNDRLGSAVAFTPDGARLAIGGSMSATIAIGDVARHEQVGTLVTPRPSDGPPMPSGRTGLAFSSDGSTLIADGEDSDGSLGVLVWDVKTGKMIRRLQGQHECVPFSLAFSPDNQTVAAGCAVHSAMIVF